MKKRVLVTCPCGKCFHVSPYREKTAKYCSRECADLGRKKEGMPEYCRNGQLKWMSKFIHGEWKEKDYSLTAVHNWARRRIPKPEQCPICGEIEKETSDGRSYFQLSNVDHTYKKVLTDYRWLCRRCHYEYDKNNNS